MPFVYLTLSIILIMITIPMLGNILYTLFPSLRTAAFGINAEKYFFYFFMGFVINIPTLLFGFYLTF